MAKKCKKGLKRIGGVCVSKKNGKRIKRVAGGIQIAWLAVIVSLTSIGGWAIFKSIVGIFKLETLNHWIMLVVGLVIIIITTKLGWRKVAN